MAARDLEFGKLNGYFIDIRDRPSGFGRTKRAGMADLATEWNPQFDTLGVEGIIAPVNSLLWSFAV